MVELSEAKQQARQMWAVGDYAEVAERIAGVGRKAVESAAVGSGDVVLDVACGAGNATIPAAQAGAKVTGLDLTPSLLEAGRAAAAKAGVEIDWVEGDAEQLPFDDDSFDAVMSVFGCMFAPDHRAAAAQLARVMKPGGRLAVCSWTPEGTIGKFFATIGSHLPPPPEGFQPPILWGNEEHVRGLFEGTGAELEFERASVDFEAASVEELVEEGETKLPPMVRARAALEPQGKWEPLRGEITALYEEFSTPRNGGVSIANEYLVAKGRKG
jgi:SAM-dependent methyltransferase